MSTGASFEFVEETGSTNADLAEALRGPNPPPEGHWLVAARQRAGKGRQGREWFDGYGNFMGSTVVDLGVGDPIPSTLAIVTALAVEQAIVEHVGHSGQVQLKWPNDVMLDNGKVSGILLELVGQRVVIGVGVNIALAPQIAGRKTSAIGDVVDDLTPKVFATTLAGQLARQVNLWRSAPLQSLFRAFEQRSIHSIGSPITVHDTDASTVSGAYAGLEETDGALRLRLADGSERVIRAGDIS